MRQPSGIRQIRPLARRSCAMAVAASGCLLAGCAQMGTPSLDLLGSNTPPREAQQFAESSGPRSELQKATEYWGKQYSKNPRDVDAGLNYAKNLKALGQKEMALGVLQQISMVNGDDRRVASEYGRLALDLDQVTLAAQLLQAADNPAAPDWRVVTARGTVLAKQGKYSEAIPFYERALALAPGQPSVLNNLALAHTMSGNPAKGEELLRQAAASQGATPKVRQNLALVLGVTGKHDEARQVAANDLGASDAAENADLIRRMTRNDKPGGSPATAGEAPVQVAKASQSAAPVKTVASQPPAAPASGWTAVVADGDTAAQSASGPALRETAH